MRSKSLPKKGHKWPWIGLGILILGIGITLGWGYLHRHWDGQSRFTLIDIQGPIVRVLSLDPQTRRGINMTLPGDLQINSVGGRGQFATAALSQAGNSSWAAASVAHTLGIFSQGEIHALPPVDYLYWWWWQSRVDWQNLDLKSTSWIDYHSSVDGVLQGQLAPGWDSQAASWFSSLAIAHEGISLVVINSTSTDGLAAAAARAIESSGIKVSQISQQPGEVSTCLVQAPQQLRKSVGLRLIRQQLGCDWSEGEQVTLTLGNNYQQFLQGK